MYGTSGVGRQALYVGMERRTIVLYDKLATIDSFLLVSLAMDYVTVGFKYLWFGDTVCCLGGGIVSLSMCRRIMGTVRCVYGLLESSTLYI